MKWRIIGTDSESLSGVAPECDNDQPDGHASLWAGARDVYGVYDCCPHPHLECGNEISARAVVAILNAMNVAICD